MACLLLPRSGPPCRCSTHRLLSLSVPQAPGRLASQAACTSLWASTALARPAFPRPPQPHQCGLVHGCCSHNLHHKHLQCFALGRSSLQYDSIEQRHRTDVPWPSVAFCGLIAPSRHANGQQQLPPSSCHVEPCLTVAVLAACSASPCRPHRCSQVRHLTSSCERAHSLPDSTSSGGL